MMKGQLAGLRRQAQQMQENMKKAQDALAEIQVEGCLLYTSCPPCAAS